MFGWLIERLPWDWLGEKILDAMPFTSGIVISVGENLFCRICSASPDIKYKLKSWIGRQKGNNVTIRNLVLHVSPVSLCVGEDYETVEVTILGESDNGKLYRSGESVVVKLYKAEVNHLREQRQVKIDICRLI